MATKKTQIAAESLGATAIPDLSPFDLMTTFLREGRDAGCPSDQMLNFCRAGLVLQQKQLDFGAAARECDVDGGPTLVSTGGGRGSGKSLGVFVQMATDDCQRQPELSCLMLRKVGKSAKEQFEALRRKVLSGLPHKWQSQPGLLTFENGSMIKVGHFQNDKDIDQYLGLEYDVIYIEEATQLSHGKIKDLLSCLRTSKPTWRPRAYYATNPGGVGHGWYCEVVIKPWKSGRETETRHIQVTIGDNKFCNKEYRRFLESLTGWRRQAWLDGDWDVMAGQFFTNWREDVHVVAEVQENEMVSWFAGFDYGQAHNTAFVLCGVDKEGRTWVVDEYGQNKTIIKVHAGNIREMLLRHNLNFYNLTYISAGRDCFARNENNRTIAMDYADEGIELVAGEVDRVSGWAVLHASLGDASEGIPSRLFVHRRCERIIANLPLLQHDANKPEDVEKMDMDPESGETGDDECEALRVALATNPNQRISWAQPVSIGSWQGERGQMSSAEEECPGRPRDIGFSNSVVEVREVWAGERVGF